MDAFDADVLIYAAVPGHPLGRPVAALFDATAAGVLAGAGSALLLPEVLGKPLCDGAAEEVQISCRPAVQARTCVRSIARRPSWPLHCGRYRLRAADATHLATAVGLGADRFITNNRRVFQRTIREVAITYPEDLPGGPS